MARRKTQRRHKQKQLRIDSMTGVNPKHTHGLGIWGNERVVMSIRVDKKLKKAFSEASKALFGSTCNPIECYMATIVGLHQNNKMNGVYPRITVDVGEIKIERNLRERRKLTKTVVETETETTKTIMKCGFKDCNNEAVGKGVYKSEKELPLCEKHLKIAQGSLDWRLPKLWHTYACVISSDPTYITPAAKYALNCRGFKGFNDKENTAEDS
jgi:hypothetical protein